MANKILATIAQRLGKSQPDQIEPDILEEQFAILKASAPEPVEPAGDTDTQSWFESQARANFFELLNVASHGEIPSLLGGLSLPVALSAQESVRALPWSNAGHTVTNDFIQPALGVIEAAFGIAETGTVSTSSLAAPSSLLFLCEELAIILSKENILRYQEDIWREISGSRQRAIHLISGPSRTADVEQTLQVGAHGPRRVYLILV